MLKANARVALASAAAALVVASAAGEPVTVAAYAVVDGERVAVPDVPMGEAAVVRAILEEGIGNSRVLEHLYVLCAEHGPRLTGSTRQEQAAAWAAGRFAAWGLDRAELWKWGEIATRFDRGPSSAKAIVGNDQREMDFTTLAWSTGTDGPVRGEAVFMPRTREEYESNGSGAYAGKWVLIRPDAEGRRGVRSTGFLMRERLELFDRIRAGGDEGPPPVPEGVTRWTGAMPLFGREVEVRLDLADGPSAEGEAEDRGTMEASGIASGSIGEVRGSPAEGEMRFVWTTDNGESDVTLVFDGGKATGEVYSRRRDETYAIRLERYEPDPNPEPSLWKLVLGGGPLGFVSSSQDVRVRTTGRTGWRERTVEEYGPDIEVNLSGPDFDYVAARMGEGRTVELEIDLKHELTPGPIPVHNVIGEIRGTERPDEVVILSAHLDSWDGPGSQGTVDNGTGSSVMLEAARILAAARARTGVGPKRTIRFILWTGEEQGLLGSRAYVEALSAEERAKISVVFVDDGGTNYQGGLSALPTMVPMLAAASAPTNGRFFSEIDRLAARHDDDPGNDADAGRMDVNIRTLDAEALPPGGGSDHAAFNAVGIPGFFWDETGRGVYGHGWHTQFDRLDQAIPEYLVQSATNSAVVAYNLANAPTLLPRTAPLPEDGQESQHPSEPEPTAAADAPPTDTLGS